MTGGQGDNYRWGDVRLERFDTPDHTLDEAAMNNIVQTLRAVDLLQDPRGVEMLVGLSEQEIGEQITRPTAGWSDDDEDSQLRDLVNRLMRRDAAMWVFVEMVKDIYGPGAQYESLRNAVGLVFAEPVLSREQRQAVHRLCEDLVCSDVAALYRLSVGPLGHALRSGAGNLSAVLNELENLPARRDGLHPVVAFVEYLAKQVPEKADQLRSWTQSIVGTRTPLLQALGKIRREPETVPDTAPRCCLVRLDCDGIDQDQFFVSLSLQDGTTIPEPLRAPDDQTYSRAEIQKIIGQVLNDPQVTASTGLVIEFVLPMLLINLPVDEWPVGYTQIKLGIRYPVVVRSLTRLCHVTDSFSDWRAKWASASAATFNLADPAVMWVPERTQQNEDQLYARIVSPPAPICLLMEKTPDPAAGDGYGGLMAALQAGVPILLWCHQPDEDIRRTLSVVLSQSAPLTQLPHRILEHRRQVARAETVPEPLIPRITLLYDDADRIPDADSPLSMPA